MQTCFMERRETTLMSLDKQQANASTCLQDLYLISFMAEPYAVAVIPFINLPSYLILHMGIHMQRTNTFTFSHLRWSLNVNWTIAIHLGSVNFILGVFP